MGDIQTLKDLGTVGQQGMSQLIHKQQPERPPDEQAHYWGKYVHKLTDALSWLFSQGQGGKDAPLPWFGALPQYALKPFKGENISEEDEQYARVLSARVQARERCAGLAPGTQVGLPVR